MRGWAIALALGATSCVSTVHKAKVCRSLARYPLGSDEGLKVRVYHPDSLMLGHGDSLCLIEQEDRSVVCTSRSGVWECSPAFPTR